MSRTRSVLVALCGYKGAGKDAAAAHLVSEHAFEHLKFAAPLKRAVGDLFRFSDAQVHGSERDVVDARWGVEPRRVLQFVGTEMFQHKLQELLPGVGRSFWARALVEDVLRVPRETRRVVVSDLRFAHELRELRALDRHGWKVLAVRIDRTHAGESDTHSSETEFASLPVDAAVTNDGSLDELRDAIERVCVSSTD